jgi:hypothetical protein
MTNRGTGSAMGRGSSLCPSSGISIVQIDGKVYCSSLYVSNIICLEIVLKQTKNFNCS